MPVPIWKGKEIDLNKSITNFCLCDVTTPKPEIPCKDVVNCQSDDDCNGGICQITEPNSWNDCILCPQSNSTPTTTRSTTTISTSTIITTGKTLSKEFTTTIIDFINHQILSYVCKQTGGL